MRTVLLALFLLFGMTSLHAQFLDGKKNLTKFNGFFNFFYAEDDGSILLEVPASKIDKEFLYVHSLRTGLGSNDIGLDRGQLGDGVVVKFIKSGKKLIGRAHV